MFAPGLYSTKRTLDYTNIVQPFCILVVALLLYSCEQDMTIEIKTNDKRLLVNGEFTTDSVIHTVKLYCSGSFITGQPQTAVTGAKVYVTDNTDTFFYIEDKNTPGLYQTSGKCCGQGGRNYFLSITNVNIDGNKESYSAQAMMPVPMKFDSMVSFLGVNGDNIIGTVENRVYYKIAHNGPDYIHDYVIVNSDSLNTIRDELGSPDFLKSMLRVSKVNNPGLPLSGWFAYFIEPHMSKVSIGDTISLVCLNFTTAQYEFLQEFDRQTSGGNLLVDNIYDPLKIPANLPTNIEPSDKAAGYFFIYSISKISRVFNE
jgi:hypothetical protein